MDVANFIDLISPIFWRHICKKTYVPLDNIPDRETFLKSLFEEVVSHAYHPSLPREYVVSNKHNLVSRIVPVLAIKDICIYYYCIKTLEDYLAQNRVDGTYGGFSMGGKQRKMENEEFKEEEYEAMSEIPLSFSPYPFNPVAWVQAWKDFQKKAFIYGRDCTCFIKFDVANFYDSINLSSLEKKVRASCNKDQAYTVDLLFHLLTNWNKRFEKYQPKTVGIPQEEGGDCSRILANFYLQDFDQVFFDFCNMKNMRYLRYADDIVVMGANSNDTKEALFVASKEFAKIGLNINSSKVHIFKSKKEYDDYWAFEIFDLLSNPENSVDLEIAIDKYKECIESKVKFKDDSVLKKIMSCNVKNIDISKKQYLLALILEDNCLQNIEEFNLRKLHSLLGETDRITLKKKLEQLIPIVFFNKFHYVLLKTNDLFKFDMAILKARIKELKL